MFALNVKPVSNDLEAKLFPPRAGAGRGLLERKTSAAGEVRVKLSVRDLSVEDGAVLLLTSGRRELASVTVKKGAARLEFDGAEGAEIPELRVGERVEVKAEDGPVLVGVLARG